MRDFATNTFNAKINLFVLAIPWINNRENADLNALILYRAKFTGCAIFYIDEQTAKNFEKTRTYCI